MAQHTPINILSKPGIRRDGTRLDGNEWSDGQWIRFRRGRPRKMRGYQALTQSLTNPSRGLFTQTLSGFTYLNSGHISGAESVQITQDGIVAVPANRTPAGFVADPNITWEFDSIFDPISSIQQLIGVATYSLTDPSNGVNGNTGTGLNIYNGDVYGTGALTKLVLPPYQAGSTTTISAASQAASCVLTVGNGALFAIGNTVMITGVLGMTQLNNHAYTVTNVAGNSVTINVNSSGFGAYTSGGTVGLGISGVSGGVVVLNPYVILYGNSGYFAWSDPTSPLNFITIPTAGQANITQQKIIKGLPLRGGGGFAPVGLFWSLDSLVRATFVGTSNGTWQWDHISTQISVLSAATILEVDGSYYWVGKDGKFYVYNGVVQELPNDLNLDFFFDNLSSTMASKSFAVRVPRWGEIWWCFPYGNALECTRAVIYNYREHVWYDTILPSDARSAGSFAEVVATIIHSGAIDNGTGQSIAISGITKATSAVVTTSGTHTFGVGNSVTIRNVMGMTQINNNTYTILAVTSNTMTLNVDSTNFGTYTNSGTVQQNLYTLWQHEVGTDAVIGTRSLAIDSYIETNVISRLDGSPPGFEALTTYMLEPDFDQTGDMTVIVRGESTADASDIDSQPYLISAIPTSDPLTQVVPMKETRRQMRLRFESNVAGGDFQFGKVVLHAAPSTRRITT